MLNYNRNRDRAIVFWSKNRHFPKNGNFLSFLVIDFDPVNWFSWFKNQDTPNFKDSPNFFLMINILFTISNFLVLDKTGLDSVPFRGNPSNLTLNIFFQNENIVEYLRKFSIYPTIFINFALFLDIFSYR